MMRWSLQLSRSWSTPAAMLAVLLASCGGKDEATQVPCSDIVAGCALEQAGLYVSFGSQPQPMQPFVLRVRLPDAGEVHARFVMKGMEMGLNRYRLVPDGPGRWQGEVTLPACIQGRSDWLLIVEAGSGNYQLPFTAGRNP